MNSIQSRFSQDRSYIERKLREGRLEDVPDEPDDQAKQIEQEFLKAEEDTIVE